MATEEEEMRSPEEEHQPTAILVIGMAGSGKSTLMQRLCSYLSSQKKQMYTINLDPAVREVNYPVNIDIRDSVKYKQVMKQYELGPNGAIMTSLNLFATKFDQVLTIVEKKAGMKRNTDAIRSESNVVDTASTPEATLKESTEKDEDGSTEKDEESTASKEDKETGKGSNAKTPDKQPKLDYVVIDTPGQIEVFTWSASGTIITESIASSMPTTLLYVIDTPRTVNPSTFMSNMLYACSIFYRTKLPFLLVFNKVDVISHKFAVEWMTDFQLFQDALSAEYNREETESYMNSLNRSMSLVLDEFYQNLSNVGVSAITGTGMTELFQKVEEKREEYFELYKPALEKKREQIRKDLAALKEKHQSRAANQQPSETRTTPEASRSAEAATEKDSGSDAPLKETTGKKTVRFEDAAEDVAEDAEERQEYQKLMAWLKQPDGMNKSS